MRSTAIARFLAAFVILMGLSLMPAAAAQQVFSGGAVAGPAVVTTPDSSEAQYVVVQPSSLSDVALSSCAGGAVIGYLVVLGTGFGSPIGTPALYCGLSMAASVASTLTIWTWHSMTSVGR